MRWLALVLTVAASFPVAAHDVRDVAASVPRDRSVTIYRAPRRNGGPMTLSSLGGFAVITETREVNLPSGEARLAFEGVADGIVAESAIVTGLPGGVIEKNRDDALLSPSALVRAAVGREVQLRRVDRKSGKATVTAARIVSASDQGVIFATAAGQEALRCSGLAEQFRYSGGGEGLFAQPTLSVLTRSSRPIHAVVKLTYIAEHFDWNANYIARIGGDGKTLNLTGWMTLANGNGVSLADARTQIVAGGLNRAYLQRFVNDQPRVVARCWPMQNTSEIPEMPARPYELVQPWLGERSGPLAKDIIVTARRLEFAAPVFAAAAPVAAPPPAPEQLGDLKLYRLPERTTIAARQMKQTRLIDQTGVPFETWYRVDVPLSPRMASWASPGAMILLRTTNDKAHHLGLPLPAGAILVEQDQDNRVMLLGEPGLRDTAEGDQLDLALGSTPDITCTWTRLPVPHGDRSLRVLVTLTNGSPHPVSIELRLNAVGGWSIDPGAIDAPKVDGVPTARVTLAGGEKHQLTVTLAAK